MKFKYAIFDMDGTTLDSLYVWKEVDRRFLGRRGLEVPQEYFNDIRTMTFYEVAVYTINTFGLNERPEDIMDEWNCLARDAYKNEVMLKPYAKEYITMLCESGVKIGIATAADESLFMPALEHNEISHFFHSYTTVGEVTRGKGFPDIYIKEAEKLGCKPCECAVFEDILPGVRAAKSAGFYTVGIYDKHGEDESGDMKKECDVFIKSYKELLR